jgi:hypothetical protein
MNMLPQVAHPLRQQPQQFGSPGFPTPPFEPLSSPRRPDRLAPLPFRSARTFESPSNLGPSYRAFPVENHELGRPSLVGGPEGQYHDPSEHMLRRKTPNGTLAAGYDGTPVQWSSKGPALKHVVLPMSGAPPSNANAPSATSYDSSRHRRRNGSTDWNHQAGKRFDAVDGGDMHITGPGHWLQLPSISDPPQNVWDQIRTYPASSYYPNNDIRVPTVLQPPYQPAPGPTASNGSGLYGPYWPDGRFVPYRPAAIGHHGYHHNSHGLSLNHITGQYSLPPADHIPSFQTPSLANNIDLLQRAGHPPLPLQNYGSALPESRHATGYHHIDHNSSMYTPISDGSRTPTAQSVHKANNPHFREKTLSWAHAIYVDLLAFLRQLEKGNHYLRNSHGSRVHSKNSIYPKPPRQPASYVGSSNWITPNSDENNTFNSRRRSNTLHAPPLPHGTKVNDWQSVGSHNEQRHGRGFNSDVPHYLSPFTAHHIPTSSPRDKAKQALEMLTTLCDQSGWSWVDAMLLAGCLAYGLEDYQRAIEWYSKILVLDPQ